MKSKQFISSYRWFNGFSWVKFASEVSFVDSKEGGKNPFWRKMIKEGTDAGSPYSREVGWTVVRPDSSNFKWDSYISPVSPSFGVYHYEISGNYLVNFLSAPPPSSLSEAEQAAMLSECKIAFLNKVRDVVNPFQGLAFLGELKETISMVRHPLKGITNHTKRYYRRVARYQSFHGGRLTAEFLKDLNNAYLQWTYGVSPLIGDIQNIKESVQRMLDGEDKDIPIIVTIPREYIAVSDRWIDGVASYNAPVGIAREVFCKESYRIKGAVRKEVLSTASPEKYRFNLGISLGEFVPTAWELLPYSFLIDYFTNVGDCLGAAFTSSTALRYYWGTKRRKLVGVIAGIALPGNLCVGRSGFAVARGEYSSFKREKPDLSVSFSDLHFQHPTVRQWCNTTSLAIARFGG